ncbi:hypothetical protein AB4254_11045 [Vibrio breoganii]
MVLLRAMSFFKGRQTKQDVQLELSRPAEIVGQQSVTGGVELVVHKSVAVQPIRLSKADGRPDTDLVQVTYRLAGAKKTSSYKMIRPLRDELVRKMGDEDSRKYFTSLGQEARELVDEGFIKDKTLYILNKALLDMLPTSVRVRLKKSALTMGRMSVRFIDPVTNVNTSTTTLEALVLILDEVTNTDGHKLYGSIAIAEYQRERDLGLVQNRSAAIRARVVERIISICNDR